MSDVLRILTKIIIGGQISTLVISSSIMSYNDLRRVKHLSLVLTTYCNSFIKNRMASAALE